MPTHRWLGKDVQVGLDVLAGHPVRHREPHDWVMGGFAGTEGF